MLCILYVNAVGLLLGLTGLLGESTLPASTSRRRLVWCATIVLSFVVPAIYRSRHTSSVSWLQGSPAYDPMINDAWLVGSATLILWGLATAARITLILHRSRKSRGSARQVIDGVPVIVTDSVGPATVGVVRSTVVVPRWVLALPKMQRDYVLKHEDEHRRSHDSLLLFAASLLLLLTPWNLALWWQLRRLRLAVEMDCDNRVVSALGNAPAYGELLFKVAVASSRGPRLQPAFLGNGLLETRLRSLVAPPSRRLAARIALPALACLLFIVALAMPHPVLESPQHNHSATQAAVSID